MLVGAGSRRGLPWCAACAAQGIGLRAAGPLPLGPFHVKAFCEPLSASVHAPSQLGALCIQNALVRSRPSSGALRIQNALARSKSALAAVACRMYEPEASLREDCPSRGPLLGASAGCHLPGPTLSPPHTLPHAPLPPLPILSLGGKSLAAGRAQGRPSRLPPQAPVPRAGPAGGCANKGCCLGGTPCSTKKGLGPAQCAFDSECAAPTQHTHARTDCRFDLPLHEERSARGSSAHEAAPGGGGGGGAGRAAAGGDDGHDAAGGGDDGHDAAGGGGGVRGNASRSRRETASRE